MILAIAVHKTLGNTKYLIAIALIKADLVHSVLFSFAHLGDGYKSHQEIDALCAQANQERIVIEKPQNTGYSLKYKDLITW